MKPISDEALGDVVGQAAPVIEIGGQMTYEQIVYTDPAGNREVILPGGTSTDGAVDTNYSGEIRGQTFGVPQTGTIFDLFTAILPLRMGEVDTDGDSIGDRAAAVFTFQPNIGMGTGFSPLNITGNDTVNINDQVFVSDQGIAILNAPIGDGLMTIDGSTYQYTHPERLF